jgi:DNA helicase-2/ATP-dependent DNA helicase PcrA
MSCDTDQEESAKIISIINTNLQNNFQPKDFAILYRTNAQSLSFENILRKSGLKYVIVGGVSFYQRKEIKDAVAYFKTALNPKDSESLERIVNEPPRGIGQTSLRKLRDMARNSSISLFEAFEQADFNSDLQKRAKKSAVEFTKMIRKYAYKLNNENVGQAALEFIEATGLLDMYKEINTEDALDRWNNIQQLLSDISNFFRNDKEATFEDYIQQISLATDLDNKDIDDNKITLMTLHAAKGLEFPVVFIAGLEKGLFPLAKAEQDKSEEEEERRLFYVGITRAKEKLFITNAQKRMRFGEFSSQTPSKFLSEIDPNFVNWKSKPSFKKSQVEARSRFAARSLNQRQDKPKPQQFFDDIPVYKIWINFT